MRHAVKRASYSQKGYVLVQYVKILSYIHSGSGIESHPPSEILYLAYVGFHAYITPEGFTRWLCWSVCAILLRREERNHGDYHLDRR